MIEPVRKELWVPASPDEAFRRFTDGIDGWWPKATHSVAEERCREVRFEVADGRRRLVEEAEDGTVESWGAVSVWEPGARLVFDWHPGRDPSSGQEVEVTFREAAGGSDGRPGTAVRLVHRGWEALGERGAEVAEGYRSGWTAVLGGYTSGFGADADLSGVPGPGGRIQR